jgi:DNA topoisomerase-1
LLQPRQSWAWEAHPGRRIVWSIIRERTMLEQPQSTAEVVALMPDPVSSAREAGLRYVSDTSPGIRRTRKGQSFRFADAHGRVLRDEATFARIRGLAIPPAWTQVWICARADGHIQAVGRDARGRKQYRYHPRWRAFRDENKFQKMVDFARALPRIRAQVAQDLARPGLPREKVLATVVRLLEETLIRVGNEEYARENKHYGLTTLREHHAKVQGSDLHFEFVGKSGKKREVDVRDPQVARVVRRCQGLPGEELFQYLDADGTRHGIDSADVNNYLRALTGHDFTAKDFRTWAGTVLAALALQELETVGSQAQAKQHVVNAIRSVSERLGNTPAVCRKCYVHPAVVESFLDGELAEALRARVARVLREDLRKLRPEEAAVAGFLHARLTREVVRLKGKASAERRTPKRAVH